ESTLMVTGSTRGRRPTVLHLRKSDLEQGRVAMSPLSNPSPKRGGVGEGFRALVGCGIPRLGQEVLIVHPEQRRHCGPGEIGEIWTAGPSVADGYWDAAEKTEQTFQARLDDDSGPYLRTGDLGFLHDGELFIAGRLKDLLIIQGRNHYPQDIEA